MAETGGFDLDCSLREIRILDELLSCILQIITQSSLTRVHRWLRQHAATYTDSDSSADAAPACPLDGAVDFLQRTLGETIEVQAVGAAGLWQVEVDSNQLESALVNLAINARDAMLSGGKLTLEAANVFLDEE